MRTIVIFFLLVSIHLFGQNEFVNIYKSYSSVTGGVDPSPTDESARFIFAVRKKIKLINVRYNDKVLELEKGDTVEFSWSNTIYPYPLNEDDTVTTETEEPEFYLAFRSEKNGHYRIGIHDIINWKVPRQYEYKGKYYVSAVKEEWDVYSNEVAP